MERCDDCHFHSTLLPFFRLDSEGIFSMSDLDLDQLIHTPEGRLVMEVLNSRRLPMCIIISDKGEIVFWYPPKVLGNFDGDQELLLEWIRILEDHVEQLRKRCPVQ